jgi:hypothetical protein
MSTPEPDRSAANWPDSASELPREPVTRVIYTSLCDMQSQVLGEMRRIRDRAVLNNAAHGIQGD